jgi:hypothetical protein
MSRTYAANKDGKKCGYDPEEPTQTPIVYIFTTKNTKKQHITKRPKTQK